MVISTQTISTQLSHPQPQNCFPFSQFLPSNELHPKILKVGYVSSNRYRESGRNMDLPLIPALVQLKLGCEFQSFIFIKSEFLH